MWISQHDLDPMDKISLFFGCPFFGFWNIILNEMKLCVITFIIGGNFFGFVAERESDVFMMKNNFVIFL